MNDVIQEIQRDLYEQNGRKVDAHYKEGYGALFVFEGQALVPQNVILAFSEWQLRSIRNTMIFF